MIWFTTTCMDWLIIIGIVLLFWILLFWFTYRDHKLFQYRISIIRTCVDNEAAIFAFKHDLYMTFNFIKYPVSKIKQWTKDNYEYKHLKESK